MYPPDTASSVYILSSLTSQISYDFNKQRTQDATIVVIIPQVFSDEPGAMEVPKFEDSLYRASC
jgi:hypothetical protein